MEKERYYYVEDVDDDGTHHYVVKGDPTKGKTISEYPTAEAAHYHARRLNAFNYHPILNEVGEMYESEIHFMVWGFWDGGIDWFLGGSPNANDFIAQAKANGNFGGAETIEEALVGMVNKAREVYPESAYVRLGSYEVHTAPVPLHEWMARAAERFPGFTLEHCPVTDPYETSWTATAPASDIGYGGYTPSEAVKNMLDAVKEDN